MCVWNTQTIIFDQVETRIMTGTNSPRTMKTVEVSWDIIEALEELGGVGVTELANHLGLPKGTVYTHLATLFERKYVVKRNDKYYLSFHLSSLGKSVRNNSLLYNAARNPVKDLSRETGEYVHLVTEEHGELIYLYEQKGDDAVGEEYFGQKFESPDYLHTSAYGKSILAYLPEERVESIIRKRGLPKQTENTITTKDDLFTELAAIREQGYALNDEEDIRGTRAVGAPILDGDNSTVLGAVSLTKTTSRMPEDEFRNNIPQKVVNTVNIIEVNIQTLNDGSVDYIK